MRQFVTLGNIHTASAIDDFMITRHGVANAEGRDPEAFRVALGWAKADELADGAQRGPETIDGIECYYRRDGHRLQVWPVGDEPPPCDALPPPPGSEAPVGQRERAVVIKPLLPDGSEPSVENLRRLRRAERGVRVRPETLIAITVVLLSAVAAVTGALMGAQRWGHAMIEVCSVAAFMLLLWLATRPRDDSRSREPLN